MPTGAPAGQDPVDITRHPVLSKSALVPKGLVWTTVPAQDKLRVLELLAARSRANYENIKTWKGSYDFLVSEPLSEKFLASFPGRTGKIEPLTHELEFTIDFAVDTASGSVFRSRDTKSSRYVHSRTHEPSEGPQLGHDTRSITTADRYLVLYRDNHTRLVSAPGEPRAVSGRQALSMPAQEAVREPRFTDPRGFYAYGPSYYLWTETEANLSRLKGKHGEEQRQRVERGLNIRQAEGPGGRWYWQQTRSPAAGGASDLYIVSVWSPREGYNPVVRFSAWGRPDGKLGDCTEWKWEQIDGIYIPQVVRTTSYDPGGAPPYQTMASLLQCEVNKPLDPQQFGYEGLGLQNGDLINAGQEQFVVRDGKVTKLEGNPIRSIAPRLNR